MKYTLLIIPIIAACLNWLAVARKLIWVERATKPLVMLGLMGWLWSVGGVERPLIWFLIGLFLSMLGDLFLILPKEQFLIGLVAFLLAQIAYIAGFNQTPPPLNLASLTLAVLITLVAARISRMIVSGLVTSGQSRLKSPVVVYSTVISLMTLSALLTLVREEWLAGSAMMVSAGGLAFLTSDTLLAWNKFVTELKMGDLIVIVTYHLGQFLIISGAAIHFLNVI